MKSFDGKVCVITGAGSGIGRALAVDLAGRRARLAISDVDEAGLAETAEQARAAGALEVHTERVDVADRSAVASYAVAVAAHFGRVNLVVNNAGVSLTGDLVDLDYADIDWILGINFGGVLNGTKEFLPHLIASGQGHLVNISSLFGLVSMPGQSAYNAAKYAVRGLSEAVREEMLAHRHPVDVTVVHPGGIKTGIARNGRFSAHEDAAESIRRFDTTLARMTPERAAAIILAGVQRRKARVLVGADAHLVHNLAKLTGARYQDIVARSSRRIMPAKTTDA